MKVKLEIGNNGQATSPNTVVEISGLETATDVTAEVTKGTFENNIWTIGTVEKDEVHIIELTGVLNESTELVATIISNTIDPVKRNNTVIIPLEYTEPEPEPEPEPVGFVIKTRDGVVAEIEGPGDVLETGISVYADGHIDGRTFLEEVISWPEEKPDWLEGNGVKFYDSGFLTKVPDTVPAWITDMSLMFRNCKINGDVSGWDTSNVTNMYEMFYGCSTFNQDLSGWDVSNVTNMSSMFSGCQSFNGDISGWDISNVTNMSNMFSHCYVFNQDISGWDISNVTYIYSMFRECQNFNQDISGWDMSNMTNMASMFSGCRSFNQDISGWDTSNVTDMSRMFSACRIFNQDLSGWCVSKISREPNQFATSTDSWTLPKPVWGTCPQGNNGEDDPTPVEGFVIKTTDGAVLEIEGTGEVSGTGVSVTADGYIYGENQLAEVISWPEEKPVWLEANGVMFYGANYLTKVPDTLPAWVTDMTYMFYNCSNFDQDLSGWDTSNVTNMESMFYGCTNFDQDLSGWDTSNVTDMRYMFVDCTNFDQDLSEWDTSNVTDMRFMFARCSNFNQDISGWDTSNVTTMYSMFDRCTNFNRDISGWDTSNVTDMRYMFRGCSSFNQDLSGWCVSNFTRAPDTFSSGTTSWTLPKPIWGTCPQGDSEGDPIPEGFVIKTTGGVVAEIEGTGQVQGTSIIVHEGGSIDWKNQLAEVISWPEEKPVWLAGSNLSFYNCASLTKVPDTLPAWFTVMSYTFYGCSSFNQDISGWDTSNVTGMFAMFEGCSNFNQDLSGWCVSNISSEPNRFSSGTISWTLPKPVWGTCPQGG